MVAYKKTKVNEKISSSFIKNEANLLNYSISDTKRVKNKLIIEVRLNTD